MTRCPTELIFIQGRLQRRDGHASSLIYIVGAFAEEGEDHYQYITPISEHGSCYVVAYLACEHCKPM
jgi:hypothetical protein